MLLGVDVGTTRAKVGAFHLDGQVAALVVAHYASAPDPARDGAEQNAGEWWRVTTNAIRQVVSRIAPGSLQAVCVGGQGPTVVAVNEALEPVAPALTWMDRRAAQETRQLGERVGRVLPSHAYLPKVIWLQRQRPDAYRAARWFCQSWDYIAAQLSGAPIVSTSPGIAPWDDELLAASELDRFKFPPARRLGERVGNVTAQAAAVTGLPEGLPVVGGISDFFEGIIGSGALARGSACDNGGSSTSFNVCWDAALPVSGVFSIPSFDEGAWYIGGPASTTGRALEWWRREVLHCAADDWSPVEQAGAVEAGSGRLIFLPYLAGERAPLWNPQARGVFFGLDLAHSQAHMTRAIMEGVAYALCHLIQQIEQAGARVDEIRACGGQAQSELWCRIKADATGCPVILPRVTDAAVLGAAIIAGVGAGVFTDYAGGAQQMVHARATLEPDAAQHARYRELYGLYRELYESVKPLYDRLSNAFSLSF